jgi:hypothetical protein
LSQVSHLTLDTETVSTARHLGAAVNAGKTIPTEVLELGVIAALAAVDDVTGGHPRQFRSHDLGDHGPFVFITIDVPGQPPQTLPGAIKIAQQPVQGAVIETRLGYHTLRSDRPSLADDLTHAVLSRLAEDLA